MDSFLLRFLEIEVNVKTKKLLLETIEKISKSNIECEELNFNMYDVFLYPKKNLATISFIIEEPGDTELTLPLNEFYACIEEWA